MRLLKSIRISQRIILLVTGLALGFIAIGGAYFFQVSVDSEVRVKTKYVRNSQVFLSEFYSDLMALNQSVLEDLGHSDKFSGFSLLDDRKKLLEKLDNSEQIIRQPDIESRIIQFKNTFREYDSLLEKYSLLNRRVFSQVQGDQGDIIVLSEKASLLRDEIGSSGATFLAQYPEQIKIFNLGFIDSRSTLFDTELTGLIDQLNTRLARNRELPESLQVAVDSYQAQLIKLSAGFNELAEVEGQLRQSAKKSMVSMSGIVSQANKMAQSLSEQIDTQSQTTTVLFIALVFSVAIGVTVGVYFIYRAIVFPMAHIQSVIRRINKGHLKARVKFIEEDELGDLGRAFNRLLDERIQTLEAQSLENEELNNSIIDLIRALGQIANKDLTVKVPVSADITGTISDAVNLFTQETAGTLSEVQSISDQVKVISDMLQEQSSVVVKVADAERKQVVAASQVLNKTAQEANSIAEKAKIADTIAAKTIADTQDARDAVLNTVNGILGMRETISETEKRLKRLGDRSQEISGIVNLINTIAERTHILALNASMHAASAGEAGKGFAVVADEVQRLAENAREATAEISSMVNNIRVETSETVNTMNQLVSEVADGTLLAKQAEQKIHVTTEATRELVDTVNVIATSSIEQAKICNNLRERAAIIVKYTQKTDGLLSAQKRYTDNLKGFSDTLLERVNVFELPHFESEKEAPDDDSVGVKDIRQAS